MAHGVHYYRYMNAQQIANTLNYTAAVASIGTVGDTLTTCYGLSGKLENVQATGCTNMSYFASIRDNAGVLHCVPFQCFGEQ